MLTTLWQDLRLLCLGVDKRLMGKSPHYLCRVCSSQSSPPRFSPSVPGHVSVLAASHSGWKVGTEWSPHSSYIQLWNVYPTGHWKGATWNRSTEHGGRWFLNSSATSMPNHGVHPWNVTLNISNITVSALDMVPHISFQPQTLNMWNGISKLKMGNPGWRR